MALQKSKGFYWTLQWYAVYLTQYWKVESRQEAKSIHWVWWYDYWYDFQRKLNVVITEQFIRRRMLSMSLVFITQSYFAVLKDIRLKSTHYFIVRIPNRWELNKLQFKNHLVLSSKTYVPQNLQYILIL